MTVYRPDPSLEFRLQEHGCSETDVHPNVMIDVHPEPEQLQDFPKVLGKEQIEVNLIKEGKAAQPIFLIASMSVYLKRALFDLLNKI